MWYCKHLMKITPLYCKVHIGGDTRSLYPSLVHAASVHERPLALATNVSPGMGLLCSVAVAAVA